MKPKFMIGLVKDGHGYEHLSKQGMVDLITTMENNGKINSIEIQKPQCSITNSEAMIV